MSAESGVQRRSSKYLGEIAGQSLEVFGVARTRERVIKYRIGDATIVERHGKSEKGVASANEFIYGLTFVHTTSSDNYVASASRGLPRSVSDQPRGRGDLSEKD
jgi:hypothetical protein